MPDLEHLLLAILAGTVPLAAAVYGLFERVSFLKALSSEAKRWSVAVVCGVVGLAVAGLARYMGYLSFPLATGQDVVNAFYTYGFVMASSAFVGSQLIHARMSAPASAS